MKALATFLLIFASTTGWAQYHVNKCKSSGLRGEICILKDFQSNDKFSSSDLLTLKNYISSHPGLPWMQLIDPRKKLLNELESSVGKIRKSDREKYIDLLAQLRIRMEPETAIEAASLFIASHPSDSFHLNSKDRLLMRRFVNVLASGSKDKVEISSFNYHHCAPNLKKFNAIMKDRERCSNLEASRNSFNLYHTLAELAACDEYSVENIGVKESKAAVESPEGAPCVVRLSDISASVGRGMVEIKSGATVYRVDWSAGHDLSGIKNDIRYWRDQLEPQLLKAIDRSPVAAKNTNTRED